ncbi:hypothetical protein HY605_03760 [Candidatus Peregrinibacteria bacterium]|nr:hypothetical protein [Candidatus Peregrinibacteria bacterium]
MKQKDVYKMPSSLLLGVWCLGLAIVFSPESSMALEECEFERDSTAKENEELLEQLRNDPFTEAFSGYIRAIEEVMSEADKQEKDVQNWSRDICRPYVVRRNQYEIDVANHNSRCAGEIADQYTYDSCLEGLNDLNRSKASLDVEVNRVNSKQEYLNNWASEIVAKGKKPREEARFILDKRNLDDALWLFAERMRREAPSDCAAMSKIIGALGRKVNSVGELTGWAGAIIGRAGNIFAYTSDRPEIEFGSSGFKPDYSDQGNQVRHFVAYFTLGVKTPTMRLREIIANCRDMACDGLICKRFLAEECSTADYKLGIVAAELGNSVENEPSLMERNLEGYVFGAACR